LRKTVYGHTIYYLFDDSAAIKTGMNCENNSNLTALTCESQSCVMSSILDVSCYTH